MAAVDAFGTIWSISTDGGSTFTAVGEVTNVDVLAVKVDTIDTSSHDSDDQWREFVGGMKDGGELSMDINYDPGLHGTILSNLGGDPIAHKIVLTDAGAAVVTFDGILTGLQAKAPYDDKLSGTATIKVSGAPVITP
jgi:predicted secreted protein